MIDTTCTAQFCIQRAEHNFGSDKFCDTHFREVIQPIRKAVARREYRIPLDYVIGVGVFDTPNADYPLSRLTRRWGNLICSETTCQATWTGVDGAVCKYCLTRFINGRESE